jgi:hypothetical protein
MGTDLFAIANAKLRGDETEADCQKLLDRMRMVQFVRATYRVPYIPDTTDTRDWEYEMNTFEDEFDPPWKLYLSGPRGFHIYLYANVAVISTVLRYRALEDAHEVWDDWFADFRQDLFDVVSVLGGTEVIYLPDNNRQPLSTYLEEMAEEGMPYEEVKTRLLQEVGKPMTSYEEYAACNSETYLLDDFADLKA